MPEASRNDVLPDPIRLDPKGLDLDALLSREWLLTNKIGAYASSTPLCANTRRYHGLLVAATRPPTGRIVALNCLMDQLVVGAGGAERTVDLSTFEFVGSVSPDSRPFLAEFRCDLAPSFLYRGEGFELLKQIILAETANAVAVRYRLNADQPARLRIWPFLALRDYHGLRQAKQPHQMTYLHYHDGIRVEDRLGGGSGEAEAANPGAGRCGAVHLSVASGQGRRAQFHGGPQWWNRFRYRADIARGQEGLEDLYTPGWFSIELTPRLPAQLTASLDDPKEVHFDATVDQKRRRLVRVVGALPGEADEAARRLALASDSFVVARKQPNAQPASTIVAGYPWFADWGRDAMIALPGLLLSVGRGETALAVLRTFAGAMDQGMIPNCFDERGGPPRYNSIDGSLWFVVAADRCAAAIDGESVWRAELAAAVDRILTAYHDGTRFGIRADADGLLAGGDENTQLTWMDVAVAGKPVTPRYGKCVEVNALWHAALRIAQRRSGSGPQAKTYADLADRVAAAFAAAFWNDQAGCLFDHVIDPQHKDASIRPNQIFAVSLAQPEHPLLSAEQQRRVVERVQRELLTPYGLRTLAPSDPRYRGRYGGSWESRDRAYHQGTVWPWLMGPFIEAYLKVNGFSAQARAQARQWLRPLEEHLAQAGLGYISEVFDGDPPYFPGGCIAQAWSIGEILRAKRLAEQGP